MIKNIFCLLSALILVVSCTSTGTVLMDTVNEDDLKMLQNLELNMIRYGMEKNEQILDSTTRLIQNLEQKNTSNREFKARLLALKAEYLLYTNSPENDHTAEVNELLLEAEKLNPQEEQIYVVKAIRENNSELKIDWLQKAEKSRQAGRVYLELGNEYFRNKQYKKAVSYYDECIKQNGDLYGEFIEKNRELAYSLMRYDSLDTDISFLTEEGETTVAGFLKILDTETSLLGNVVEAPESEDGFSYMKENGFFAYPSIMPSGIIVRKDAAFIVAALIARRENNPEMLDDTAVYYREMGWKSPIPDLSVADKYFSAAVMMVEYEIMELPDGKKFFPAEPLGKKEILGIITQLKKLYP